ncbi:hypothetical protein ACFLSW_06005 [Candidatus Bipolaricaulota bacterium]
MRSSFSCFVVLLSLLCCTPVSADDVQFESGSMRCTWGTGLQHVIIHAETEIDVTPGTSSAWVLTAYAHRFEDGVFAWQMHYSRDLDSVLVLPNDFLTARHFTTDQLGIEIELDSSGSGIDIRIPILGTIPQLIVAGDLIELHALWVQQEPLVTMLVPDPGNPVVLQTGGGATVPEPSTGLISSSPLPEADRYERGQAISHQFILHSDPDSDESSRALLTYTLMRIRESQADELMRFAPIPYDPTSGIHSYVINTSALDHGEYRLFVDSSDGSVSYQLELQIVQPNE